MHSNVYGQAYRIIEEMVRLRPQLPSSRPPACTPPENIGRDLFFENIVHGAHHHRSGPDDPFARWPQHVRQFVGLGQRIVHSGVDAQRFKDEKKLFTETAHCGWWWCFDSARPLGLEPPWKELTRALTALQKRRIDPWSRDVARVAYQFTRASHVGDEAEHYRIAQKGLSDLLTEVDGMSHASALLRTCLKEIETRLGGVAGLRPEPDDDGGAPLNVPQMEALLLAAELKWDASAAAAVLFLTGVLPSIASR